MMRLPMGYSLRGGYPVERKLMRQWFLRITAYAERLLEGLDNIEFTESLKEIQQRYWIGRSEGAEIAFPSRDIQIITWIFSLPVRILFSGQPLWSLHRNMSWLKKSRTTDNFGYVKDYIHWSKEPFRTGTDGGCEKDHGDLPAPIA